MNMTEKKPVRVSLSVLLVSTNGVHHFDTYRKITE